MGMYVDPGNESFFEDCHSDIYVDKTGLLEVLNRSIGKSRHFFSVSRARRFGKSMAAGMIDAFYSCGCDSRDLFSSFAIAQTDDYKKHINQYHVLHFDASSFLSPLADVNTYIQRIDAALLRDMKKHFPESLEEYCPNAPEALLRIYEATNRKFIVIIDEWDCLIRDEKNCKELILDYLKYLRGFFKTNESRKFLALGYITGILPIKKIDGESAMNNFREFTMISPRELMPFFGFTEAEVEGLCARYNMDPASVRQWYDGYRMQYRSPDGTLHKDHIYNPESLVNAMLDHSLESYWKNTASFTQLNNYIQLNMAGLKEDITRMLAGEHVPVDTHGYQNDLTSFTDKDDVLTALIHMGYLGYDANTEETFIPNEEVATVFQYAIRAGGWDDLSDALSHSDALLRAIWAKDADCAAEMIAASHQDYTSILKYNDENSLALAIQMACYTARKHYLVFRELPAGRGFADLAFLPKPGSNRPPMIVELKWDHSAETAISQIHSRNYTGKLCSCGHILLAGINYSRKEKKYTCVIEDWIG